MGNNISECSSSWQNPLTPSHDNVLAWLCVFKPCLSFMFEAKCQRQNDHTNPGTFLWLSWKSEHGIQQPDQCFHATPTFAIVCIILICVCTQRMYIYSALGAPSGGLRSAFFWLVSGSMVGGSKGVIWKIVALIVITPHSYHPMLGLKLNYYV